MIFPHNICIEIKHDKVIPFENLYTRLSHSYLLQDGFWETFVNFVTKVTMS